MSILSVKRINLSNFRNYEAFRLEINDKPVVITGLNGVGKTNLLEAISFLTPGRGFRGAKLEEVQKHKSNNKAGWAVSSLINFQGEDVNIGTGFDNVKNKRIIRINQENQRSQASLAEYMQVLWLTPQMDRLFMDSSYARRKFLDRLIFSFDTAHIGRISKYEKNIRQRMHILKNSHSPDDKWLSSIESIIAETGVAIAAARLEITQKLQDSINDYLRTDKAFLIPNLNVDGFVENLLNEKPAIEVEDIFLSNLKLNRSKDGRTEKTEFGVHRTDFKVFNQQNGIAAEICSTGEQKSMLIAIILSHAWLIKGERGNAPILLLDEIIAHLDENRREALFNRIFDLKSQSFMTGTDKSYFDNLKNKVQYVEL